MGRHDFHDDFLDDDVHDFDGFDGFDGFDEFDEPPTLALPAPREPRRRRLRAQRVEAAAFDTLIAHARRRALQVALASRPTSPPEPSDPWPADPDEVAGGRSSARGRHPHRRAGRGLRPGRHRR
ncbi:hypothetical protein LQ327_25850 [Actinomycetospora endophytica]|uniref:Uncharacterized protein n=1 Tax=Actinomycetospora endophytica TaxID=2291215 RepID=A0ABS8PEU7_9PSEU|nr:hypothetical protein [Actinomycetospora endophytica]MCD2196800.1 hypothetical protein [Actinomycetospora endophytica]